MPKHNSEWINIYNNIVTTASVTSPCIAITPRNSARFAYYKNLFQQYKITRIHYQFKPLVENGTYPMPLYCKIVTDDSKRPPLESLKETGNLVDQRDGLKRWFSISGRQNDLNYWFDMDVYPSIMLYYLPLQSENPGKKYMVRVTIQIKFRMPLIPNESTTKLLIEQNNKVDKEKEDMKKTDEEKESEIKEMKQKIAELSKKTEKILENQDQNIFEEDKEEIDEKEELKEKIEEIMNEKIEQEKEFRMKIGILEGRIAELTTIIKERSNSSKK